jgi:two-component system sensor histidine kinase MprB
VSALAGWVLAAALACACVRLRRRLELVAVAEHELRGPATAIGLAVAALRREPGGLRRALAFESELERMRAGLDDLNEARSGRRAPARPVALPLERVLRGAAAGWRPAGRPMRFRWDAGPAVVRADRGRLAQAFSNLLANAVEHGSGRVEVRGSRSGERVRVEISDEGPRGRGLGIAARAVEEAGGVLEVERAADGTTVAVELPLAAEG